MSSNREKTLSSIYAELNKFKQAQDYERALKAANRILHTAPTERKAFHCKIVCLIQLSKFEEALNAFHRSPELGSELHFEKAYCHYRVNDPLTALKVIDSAEESTDQINELKAQVLYRLEKYDDCFALYKNIIKTTNDEYEQERQANISAVIANIDTAEASMFKPKEVSYEICYNNAYKMIKEDNYTEAELKLKHCETMCRNNLEEDGYTEEEIESELAVIRVQLAYCYQRLNRVKEAQAFYKNVLALKCDDTGLVAVASNNMVVINKDHNVFDSKKKMKHATTDQLNHKLNSQQRKIIAMNNCLLHYYIGQSEPCRKLCEKLEQTWPDMKVNATIIKAMLLAKDGKINSAIEILKNVDATSDQEKLCLQLICVHLLLTQGDKKQAIEMLQSLGNDTYRPGIVGALVTLNVGIKNEQGAALVFANTVDWYRKAQVGIGDVSNMWFQAAEFHMLNGHPSVAANCLEEILNNNPNDLRTIAKLVLAYVQFDSDKASALSSKLPSIKSLTKDVDSDNIESSNWIFGLKAVKVRTDNSIPSTPRSDTIQKKKTRKRKGKLPKNYNAEATPDPERWLPKHERTGFRKKRDRRAKDIIKGSQGQAVGASDALDFSKVLEESESKTSIEDPSPKYTGAYKKSGQKKKRKGSKW